MRVNAPIAGVDATIGAFIYLNLA
ncbi:Uncharacterized protein BCRIVMBC126_02081 [Bacillus wiedmannii]|nr:Uncharacterized protein BCRIVMBC126_02081 [Bacillus wiedmannii]